MSEGGKIPYKPCGDKSATRDSLRALLRQRNTPSCQQIKPCENWTKEIVCSAVSTEPEAVVRSLALSFRVSFQGLELLSHYHARICRSQRPRTRSQLGRPRWWVSSFSDVSGGVTTSALTGWHHRFPRTAWTIRAGRHASIWRWARTRW